MSQKHQIQTILLISLLVCLFTSGCSTRKTASISKNGFYFDTAITITLYGTKNEAVLEECFSLCSTYEQLLSKTIPDSDISMINKSSGTPVTVSPETTALLQKAIHYSELSNGTFDCTIAPISALWNFSKDSPSPPAADQLESMLPLIDYHNIRISNNTVTLSTPEMAIDLGGIAKGCIADKLKEYLLSQNITSALINLGGNVLTIGTKPDGSPFTIGIQKPFEDGGTPITAVPVSDQSLVTSGVYERYFKAEGKLYHHLLNPATGYPFNNGLYSVTILSDSSVDGDALSTACFGMGLENGMALIETLDNVEALFISDTYELHYSSGFPNKE